MADNLIKAAHLRALAVEYARAFIGKPYMWGTAEIPGLPGHSAGGDDPIAGFDCSGFISEDLQAVGVLPHGVRKTAQGLYTLFKPFIVAAGYPGCLAFWLNEKGEATHVMLMVDSEFVIGASGGGSKTTTAAIAAEQNAFIKLRPLSYRGGPAIIVDPFKGIA